jgi:hypothetical protein
MNTPWQIRRRVIARSDGERRWDAAYQFLLQWAMDHHAGTCPVLWFNRNGHLDKGDTIVVGGVR